MNKLILSAGALVVLATASLSAAPVHATSNCVDGSAQTYLGNNVYKSTNLETVWNGPSEVKVSTKDGKPVCNDVTLYFTSYTMPDTWNQDMVRPFNETAKPQKKFDTVSVTFKKDQASPSATLKVKMPADCKNVQTDLYHGPEITEIVTKGHGAKLVGFQLRPKTVNDCTVAVVEEPKVLATSTDVPSELPKTGNSVVLGAVLTVVASVATYAVALKRQS